MFSTSFSLIVERCGEPSNSQLRCPCREANNPSGFPHVIDTQISEQSNRNHGVSYTYSLYFLLLSRYASLHFALTKCRLPSIQLVRTKCADDQRRRQESTEKTGIDPVEGIWLYNLQWRAHVRDPLMERLIILSIYGSRQHQVVL